MDTESALKVRANPVAHCRLAARGLIFRGTSRRCNTYIEQGVGELPQIVDKMVKSEFFSVHTSYKTAYAEVRGSHLQGLSAGDGYARFAKRSVGHLG